EFVCLSITVVEFLFTTFTGLFHKKCDRLKARVVIYAYNHHVRLLSPEPMVVKQPQFTRVEEPTLLCNQVLLSTAACRERRPASIALGVRRGRHPCEYHFVSACLIGFLALCRAAFGNSLLFRLPVKLFA